MLYPLTLVHWPNPRHIHRTKQIKLTCLFIEEKTSKIIWVTLLTARIQNCKQVDFFSSKNPKHPAYNIFFKGNHWILPNYHLLLENDVALHLTKLKCFVSSGMFGWNWPNDSGWLLHYYLPLGPSWVQQMVIPPFQPQIFMASLEKLAQLVDKEERIQNFTIFFTTSPLRRHGTSFEQPISFS